MVSEEPLITWHLLIGAGYLGHRFDFSMPFYHQYCQLEHVISIDSYTHVFSFLLSSLQPEAETCKFSWIRLAKCIIFCDTKVMLFWISK